MKKLQLSVLSVLSGLLLFAAWPVSPFTFLIFIGWIPLLYVGEKTGKRLHFFFYSFLTILIWNACTTWWIWNSTDVGAIAAIIANSLLMTLPWWGYQIFKKRYGSKIGLTSLVLFWMTFEYIHLNWQLSWPWLTLGNAFATHPGWVQWYEYTGTSGGSLWVLLSNILLFQLTNEIRTRKYWIELVIMSTMIILAPLVASYLVEPGAESVSPNSSTGTNVVIVQPNIDPYNEKFDAATISTQLNTLISLSEKGIDSNTRLVLWPETALSGGVLQNEFENTAIYRPVFDFVKRHPRITLQTGVESYKTYGSDKSTPTAQFDETNNTYFDAFNSAVAIKEGAPVQFYNKSKLVPGVETLPDFLLWMAPVFEKFGGTASGYGRSKESSVFSEPDNPYVTAPIICYESIYSEYVASYVKQGANLLTIMTNDGWWGNTPGHKQHLQYARLRAVETRKWIARSANTGISAVINSNGEILQTQPWDKTAFIKANIPTEDGPTFYVNHGDVLSKISLVLAFLFIGWNIYMVIRYRLQRKNGTRQ